MAKKNILNAPVSVTGFKNQMALALQDPSSPVLYAVGVPGIGKTAVAYQVAEQEGYACICFMLSQMLPEDIGGIVAPDMQNMQARRLMPDVVAKIIETHESTGKPVLAFFDELNNAYPSVLSACFKLLHEKEAAGFKVPESTRFFAAGNPPETSSVAVDLPKPLLNRMVVLDYTGPTFQEFESYAFGSNMHPIVTGFIHEMPEYLIEKADFVSADANPTPRSWESVSDMLHVVDKRASGPDPVRNTDVHTAIAARVGNAAATAMQATMKYANELVPYEDCIADPEGARVPESSSATYMMAALMAARMPSDTNSTRALAALDASNGEETPESQGTVLSAKDEAHASLKYVLRLHPEFLSVYLAAILQPNSSASSSEQLARKQNLIAAVIKEEKANPELSKMVRERFHVGAHLKAA